MPPARWLTVSRSEEQWWTRQAAAEAADAPWAQRLVGVIPTIVGISGVVEPVEAASDTVLSSCHWVPNAFREAGHDALAVVIWKHAGAIPLRWDRRSAVLGWTRGVPGAVNPPWRARSALTQGSRDDDCQETMWNRGFTCVEGGIGRP